MQMIRAVLLLILAGMAHATVWQVGSGLDFNTPALCAASASVVAGDTCNVHTGSYAGFTAKSGSQAGGYITFIANGTTLPTCFGNSGPSKVSCAGPNGDAVTITGGISLAGISYAAVVGFTLGSNTISVNTSSHNNVIAYNKWTGATGVINQTDSVGSTDSDNRIAYNVIDRTGITASTLAAIYFYGDRNLFEHNESINGSSDFLDGGGLNNIVRHNYFHGSNGSTSGEHIDFVQVQGSTGPTWSYGLTENNVEDGCTNQCHFYQIRGGAGFIPDTSIVRLNYAHNLDSLFGGFGDHSDNGGGASLINTWCYQNTAALETSNNAAGNGCGFDGFGAGTSLNNIFYNVQPGNSPNQTPIIQDTGQYLAANGDLTFTSGYSGAYNTPYSSEPTYAALHNVNPLFANYPTDGTLQASSPALHTGVSLTTATNSGVSSNSLTVADGHGFQPGWGPKNLPSGSTLNALVAGDWVKIGSGVPSASNTAQITAISYGSGRTATFTLSANLSWSINDQIYLYKDSDGTVLMTAALPNIGAFPVSSSGAQLSTAPASINFGNQQTGTTSAASTVTVSNPGSTPTGSVSCSMTGTDASQFSFTGTCSGTLAAGASFPISVFCSPTTTGLKSANFTVTDNTLTASTTLSCTGTTTAPVLVNAPTSIAYGNQPTGTTSAAQAIVVTNTGTATATGITCTLTTGTQYAITDIGNCTATLAVNASFTIHTTFTPTTTGLKNDTLTVAATGGVTATTTLSGTGITTAPAFSLTPASVACGSSNLGVQVSCPILTLTNTGSASGTVSTIVFSPNASSYSYTATAPCNSLPATLTASSSCTITPKMTPSLAGSLNTTLTVTDTPDSLTASSTVTGTGVNPNAPTLVNFTACVSGTTPVSCMIPSTTSGNLLVVGTATSFGCSPGTPAITDGGDTFVEANIGGTAALASDTGVNHQSDLLYALTAGGKTTVTMTTTPACLADLVVWEWSGVTTLTNVSVLNTQAATTSPAGASVTLSQSSQVSLSIALASHPITGLFAGNTWTNDSLAFSVGWAHLVNASTGATNAQWTTSSSSTYASSTASFGPTPPVVNTPGGLSLNLVVTNGQISH